MIADTPHSQSPQELVVARTRRLLRQVAHWLDIRIPDPDIRFDIRGRAAGQAKFGRAVPWVIRYNPVLLAGNTDAFLAETVPHEVAHLAAFARYGSRIRPHGAEWRAIMDHFGAAPQRCHRYDVAGIAPRRLQEFSYHCGCRNHLLSSIRHNRIVAGKTYLCRQCLGPLRPGRQSEMEAPTPRRPTDPRSNRSDR